MKEPRSIRIKASKLMLVITLFSVLATSACLLASGYSSYGSAIPGDLSGDCDPCHPPGDFAGLNPYGTDFANEANHASDPASAIDAIMALDSDGDGFFNRNELENGSNPGDVNDIPSGLPKLPVLEITYVNRSAKITTEGETLYIYCHVNNTGDGDAFNVEVSLCEGNDTVQILTGIEIDSGEMRPMIFAIEPDAGIHEFCVRAVHPNSTAKKTFFIHVDPFEERRLPAPGALASVALISGVAVCYRLYLGFRRDE